MKKNGFTLVELLGVIVILAAISILALPPIIEQIRKANNSLSNATIKLINSATEIYMEKNRNEYPISNGNVFCISLQTLIDSGDLAEDMTDVQGNDINKTNVVKVEVISSANRKYSIVKDVECSRVDNTSIPNADTSGANVPLLDDNMIPIKWDGIKWVKADRRNPNSDHKWYDYNAREWANAVLVTSTSRQTYKDALNGTEILEDDVIAYLVWIPRYRYKLFNTESLSMGAGEIDIVFESKGTTKSKNSTNNMYLTHPAFTFGKDSLGNDIEISGFWVGKYETTGTASIPTILPNKTALLNQSVNTQFNTAKKFNALSTYGLTVDNDAHMMKNNEWGAVAYLSQSKFGKYGNPIYDNSTGLEKEIWLNNSSTYTTGCAGNSVSSSAYNGCQNYYYTTNGVKASTTGNIYGIYDMSGGSYEYVMGAMYNNDNSTVMVFDSEFDQATIDSAEMSKYINKYLYGVYDEYSRRILGDATSETRGWYNDQISFVDSSYPWFIRGGFYDSTTDAGIFYSYSSDGYGGGSYTFRTVILGK